MTDSERLATRVERAATARAAADRKAALYDTVARMAARQGVNMAKFNDPERADALLAQAERDAHTQRLARQADILLSRLPSDYRDATLPREEWALDALAWLREFRACRAAGRRPPSLLIMGPVGTGKTWTAAALARMILTEDTVPVTFITTQEMINAVKPAQGGLDVDMAQFEVTPLLVLDDFGNERLTEWAADQLHRLAHARNHNGRPLIITTNFSGEEIRDRYSERVVERLFGGARLVTIQGESRRELPLASLRKQKRPSTEGDD